MGSVGWSVNLRLPPYGTEVKNATWLRSWLRGLRRKRGRKKECRHKIGGVHITLTLWRVRVNIDAVEMQQFILCVCCWALCHCQRHENTECYTRMLSWRICITGNNKTYFGLHVNRPIFFADFYQIWSVSTDFHKSPSSGNRAGTVHAEWWTDKRTDMTRHGTCSRRCVMVAGGVGV